jgi:hypothetical protein
VFPPPAAQLFCDPRRRRIEPSIREIKLIGFTELHKGDRVIYKKCRFINGVIFAEVGSRWALHVIVALLRQKLRNLQTLLSD